MFVAKILHKMGWANFFFLTAENQSKQTEENSNLAPLEL